MQLLDLIKPLDQFTDDELRERLRVIRNNRTVTRPAAKAHAKKAAKKTSRAKVSKNEKLIEGLTEEQKLALIAQLQGELL